MVTLYSIICNTIICNIACCLIFLSFTTLFIVAHSMLISLEVSANAKKNLLNVDKIGKIIWFSLSYELIP